MDKMQNNSNEIKKIVRESVHETLVGLGFDVYEVHENQADMAYLRKLRVGSERMAERVKGAVITVSVPTVLYLIWEAVKNLVAKG